MARSALQQDGTRGGERDFHTGDAHPNFLQVASRVGIVQRFRDNHLHIPVEKAFLKTWNPGVQFGPGQDAPGAGIVQPLQDLPHCEHARRHDRIGDVAGAVQFLQFRSEARFEPGILGPEGGHVHVFTRSQRRRVRGRPRNLRVGQSLAQPIQDSLPGLAHFAAPRVPDRLAHHSLKLCFAIGGKSRWRVQWCRGGGSLRRFRLPNPDRSLVPVFAARAAP